MGSTSNELIPNESSNEGEPSTPQSNNNVNHPVIGDAQSAPHKSVLTNQHQKVVDNNVIQRRKWASQRCGCEAKLHIKRTYKNKWRVYKFLEKHNHRLVREEDYMYLKVLKEMYGGFENVGVTDVECRNYKRDLNLFIGNCDAQMVVEKLLSRQDFWDKFSFEFKKHKVDKTLYNMVLVLFTSIDNHSWCILFGAALLASRNTKKYRWLLKWFKKIFGSVPKEVITDQDPAMKNAIEEIFPDSRHRLCMWHIMKKLAGKFIRDRHEIQNGACHTNPKLIETLPPLLAYWEFVGLESVRYGVSNILDTAYWGFLGVGTTFDIFQNIHILYLQYGVLVFSGYGVLIMFPSWSLVSAGTDTPYLP
ncbi:FAR1-related sequence 5-like protein [Tanacetum coccineum]